MDLKRLSDSTEPSGRRKDTKCRGYKKCTEIKKVEAGEEETVERNWFSGTVAEMEALTVKNAEGKDCVFRGEKAETNPEDEGDLEEEMLMLC